jgi:hypothetical protein
MPGPQIAIMGYLYALPKELLLQSLLSFKSSQNVVQLKAKKTIDDATEPLGKLHETGK